MKITERFSNAIGAFTNNIKAQIKEIKPFTKSGILFDTLSFFGLKAYPSIFGKSSDILREESRKIYWESSHAKAMVGRLADNVIGTGLAIECKPIWKLLDGITGWDEAKKHEFQREIETRFDLWASSTEPDARGKYNFYQLQMIEYINRLIDGETISVIRYQDKDTGRMSPVSIQMYSPDQMVSPKDQPLDENLVISEGVKINKFGKAESIYLTDELFGMEPSEIPYSENGRRYVIHSTLNESIGALRGTPIFADCVNELKKIADYSVAELAAAVINAVFAVWIEPSSDNPASNVLSGIRKSAANTEPDTPTEKGTPTAKFDKPGLIVQNLQKGEKINSFDTKRPNVNFGEFVRNVIRPLAAGKGIPIEVLEESFNANYSASRASLLLFFRKVMIERTNSEVGFLTPIYHAWFIESVRSGSINIPGFDSKSPVIRAAWLYHSWNGDSMPNIDPLKEAMSNRMKIEDGTTTRERVAMETNGSDAMENIERLKIENRELAIANAEINRAETSPENVLNITSDGDGTK